jgi:long-chain fatty acid transport protein
LFIRPSFAFAAVATAWALAASAPRTAYAGGFLAARFGGEQGHPMTDDPSALYYNPAGLSLKRGTRLHLNGLLAWRLASYDRPTGAIDNPLPSGAMGAGTPESDLAVNSGKADLANVIVSPFLALTTDFGVKNLGVGIGFAVPFGGQASWNQNAAYRGSLQYPGAVDGVQRWATIDGIIRSQYIMIGGAYTIQRARLSIGATVNIILNEANTVRARTAAGTDDVVTNGIPTEGRSQIDVRNVTASIGVGVIWQPADNWWLGISYQSQPGFGEHRLSGTLRNKLGSGMVTEQPIELTQSLPDVLRFGFRVRPIRRLELRLFGEYQRWSVFNRQCVLDANVANRKCAVLPDGSLDTASGGAGVIVVLPRDWKDGGGVRAGLSYFVRDSVELLIGAGYDANVVPNQTLDPSLIDQEKITVSAGGRFEFVRRKLALAIAYTQVIYLDRTAPVRMRDANGQPIAPLSPSRNPDFGGKYTQALGLVSLALEYNFTGP